MKLTPTLFQGIYRLFFDEVLTIDECESYSERLDSVEECFAWILLTNPRAKQHTGLLGDISELAHTQLAVAQTRRTQSNFPQAEAKAYGALSDALHSLISADKTSNGLHADAYAALVSFAQKRLDEYHGRHGLGIRI